ncbi:hypothetical protein [Trichlorobacter ammonificans]|uniref:TPR repeat-containing protein n=1 Tax=Trichlorobacter ammonificans TaxID=2916410 RepID=A0ABN8HMR5_9BACT|nr:hypothetical protein [Trichlorobacter ammonificans]CAH2032516.1 TPR repeat-containing protein [Trichlorobacter ammonificans]
MQQQPPTPIEGVRYFQPAEGFRLAGRDGLVDLAWGDLPIPLQEADYVAALANGTPDYDQVGRGLYHALRRNPDCANAARYADVLQQAYPHIIAEIGGEAIMLDAREVDLPYLDRKVSLLRIMTLITPDNAGLWREIGRTLMERGGRLEATHLAVQSWYGAEKYLARALALDPDDLHTCYQYGEVSYILGRYEEALAQWEGLLERCSGAERRNLEGRIAAIRAGERPLVPPVDYLTALSVAFEQHQAGDIHEAAAIVEDVLADPVFCAQFPLVEMHRFLEQCHRSLEQSGMLQGRC